MILPNETIIYEVSYQRYTMLGFFVCFQLSKAPTAATGTIGVPSSSKAKDNEDVDIEAMLAQLKSWDPDTKQLKL